MSQSTEEHKVEKSAVFAPRTSTNNTKSVIKAQQQYRYLRLILTAGVIALILGSVSLLSLKREENLQVQVVDVSPQKNEDQNSFREVQGLTYKGISEDGRNFIIIAKKATEITEGEQITERIDLTAPYARIDSSTGFPINIRSNSAVFYKLKNLVNLNGNVIITRPDIGYTFHTETATADLNQGIITSPTKVQARTAQTIIIAEGMTITDDGANINFAGPSSLTMYPDN